MVYCGKIFLAVQAAGFVFSTWDIASFTQSNIEYGQRPIRKPATPGQLAKVTGRAFFVNG